MKRRGILQALTWLPLAESFPADSLQAMPIAETNCL